MIQKEREMRNDTYRRLKFETKYGDQEMNGLNEQEALEYALMISRDEEEAKRLDEALNASSDFKGKGKQTDEMEDQDLAEALERSSRIKGREEDSREEGSLFRWVGSGRSRLAITLNVSISFTSILTASHQHFNSL